jgi:putative ABC transport system permease protein
MIVKMAWRNVFRHKRRTVLTLITISVGIFISIFGEGVNRGMYSQVKNTLRNSSLGYYKIYSNGYYEERITNDPLEYPIKNYQELEKKLKGKKYSSRLVFKGTLTDRSKSLNVNFIGVDKDEENSVFDRDKCMVEGNFDTKRASVVIGYKLAELFDLELGSEIVIGTRTATKALNAYDVKVGGIIKTGNPFMDSSSVFMSRSFAEEFANAKFINDIVIGEELSIDFVESINNIGYRIVPLVEELVDIEKITRVRRKFFAVISIAILMMAGLGIANTMLMAMMERQREIGIMMAGGMRRPSILSLFLLEGSISGIIGGFIGFIGGTLLVLYYEKNGMYLGNIEELGTNLPLSDRLYFNYDLRISLFYFLVAFLCAVISAFYPAYKATKLSPVEVLKNTFN